MDNIVLNSRLGGNEENWVFIGKKMWHQDHTGIIYPPVWLYPNFDRGRNKVPNAYAHELAREDYAFVPQVLDDIDISVEYKCPYGSVLSGGIVFRATDSSSFYVVDIIDRGRKGHMYEIVLSIQEKNGYRRESARALAPHSIVPEHIVQAGTKTREDWDISSPDWIKVRVQATGTYIRVSADDNIVIEIRDSKYNAGYAGLVARGAVYFQNLTIKGTKGQLEKPWEKHEGELPEFFYPGEKQPKGFNAFPVVCCAKSGTISAAWGHNPIELAKGFPPKQVLYTSSQDGGQTWSPVQKIYEKQNGYCHPVSIFEHKDGNLTCLVRAWEEKETPTILRSYNKGQTWQVEGELEAGGKPLEKNIYLYSPMQRLADGTVVMTHYQHLTDDSEKSKCRSVLFRSLDDGYTWQKPTYFDESNYDHNECMLVEEKPGKIIAFMRTVTALNMWTSISEDGGKTWTPLKQSNASGDCPQLIRHSSGTLVLFNRGLGTFIKLSYDNGKTWSNDYRISPCSAMAGMTENNEGKIVILMHEGYRVPSYIRGQIFEVTLDGLKEVKPKTEITAHDYQQE